MFVSNVALRDKALARNRVVASFVHAWALRCCALVKSTLRKLSLLGCKLVMKMDDTIAVLVIRSGFDH